MSKSAGHKHLGQVQRQSIRQWADEKHDARYVTRRELKQFLTIYDKAAAKIRGEESEKLEGTLLLTLTRLNEYKAALQRWYAAPWWVRLFLSPPLPEVPVVVKAEAPEGIQPEEAEETLEEASGLPDTPDTVDEGGLVTADELPAIEQPQAMSRELPWACRDCDAKGQHLVAQSDLHPLPPTCPHCGGARTRFVVEDDGA